MTTLDKFGLIQVYTGNGKGKTTASLGLAFRAAGHGFKVCMIQFMKKGSQYGEAKAAQLIPGFNLIQVGREEFVNLNNPDSIDCKLARDGWELAKAKIDSGEYAIVILDEINVAMNYGLLETKGVVTYLNNHKNQNVNTEIILTGRYAPTEILEIADLVTEMREIRHPAQNGVPARKGIDY
ncbi:MAG TPA: cob(I)yrinic acid a,c-diamide adenosyltransferase [Methylomusa anaerophila]|uniref:Cob(I)yrinic acid a,c-diamide adenosyltransferase n=1 Tax=Methylomusa anaerophila TaxID=1930071 RepID=A0A348API0_9FIRM|nr:cob(I)yrinic acid a,c-diamide adenosyltransferase [Methylomusa anaerophila]BBB92978.1 Cob(I)yrinic acid a,c-diamide adenosyltransferase [Methylomusa anaerophila]HML87188.1 cob(I)yrinic acid a,c-diamide adenosyltransferase [Methylomusa anaerophila]